MGQLCEIELDGAPASVRSARAFVDVTLTAWNLGYLQEPAVLLTSELVTNAVLHARTPLHLAVHLEERQVTVEVTDGSSRLPTVQAVPVDREQGRGLALVARLAARWGARAEPDGKTVWFSLSLNGHSPSGTGPATG